MLVEARAVHHEQPPGATTGSQSPEKQIHNFNPSEWQIITSHSIKPQINTVANLLEQYAGTKLGKFYAENVEFGHYGIHDHITEEEAHRQHTEHEEEEHVDYHEAGHYAVAKSYGYEATATSIPGPGFRGLTKWWGSFGEAIKTRLWRMIVIAEGGAIGAGDNAGAGSDHGKSRYCASILSHFFKEGSVSSIISSARSEASSRIKRGSIQFKQLARTLFFKKTI